MSHSKRYIHIDKGIITQGEIINFNLYTTNHEHTQMSLFLQSDSMIEGDDKVRLREIEELYICDDASSKYQHYVETHIQTIASSKDIPTEKKAEIVYENATEVLDEMFRNPEALGNNKRASNMVSGFVSIVFKDNFAIESLMKITAHDYYTHTHSINVCLYSLSLGVFLGLDEENLQILGIASLLHDLGKSEVDYKIINKNGKLTESEFNQMKKHPKAGYDIAIAIGITDRRILTGIRDHHEKMDGNGYPFGIKQEKISLFARIIGTCDVFDALTTKRSYKEAMSSFQALSIMKNQMDTHLDMKMVNALVRMIAKK